MAIRMGSRTGSSYTNIAGKGKYINKNITIITTTLGSGIKAISPEQFKLASLAAIKILIHSNAGLTTIYYTARFAEKIVKLYPQIEKAYNSGGENAVAQLLAKEMLKIGSNVALNFIVSEVTDNLWDTFSSEHNLNLTDDQDRLAKFIVGQSVQLAISAAKEKKPLTKDFIYKQVVNVALDYWIESLVQSRSELHTDTPELNPFDKYCNLNELGKKLLLTSIEEVSHEIAETIYDKVKEKNQYEETMPDIKVFKSILIKSVKEKYPSDELEQVTSSVKMSSRPTDTIVITDEENYKSKNIILANNTSVEDNKRFWLRVDPRIQKFLKPEHKDLINLATALLRVEYLQRDPGLKKKVIAEKIIFRTHTKFDEETIQIIEQLSTFLLNKKIVFQISSIKPAKLKKPIEQNIDTCSAICLFSGGVDSLAGLLKTRAEEPSVKGVFVCHQVSKISKIVKDISEELGIKDTIYWNWSQTGGHFLHQTRGFVFLTVAAVYADIFKSDKVIISECGVTKYQPNLSVTDEITKTTHPLMIKLAKKLYEKKGIDFTIEQPFENKTKAEILRHILKMNADSDLLTSTHSCRITNIRDKNKKECGYCMGCLIKHVALAYITSKKQNQFLLDPITHPEDYVTYNLDEKKGWRLKVDRYEAIKQLISFTASVLGNNLNDTTKSMIVKYGKQDLFNRFSEDVIYGLSFMRREKMVKNKQILSMITNYEKENWFDTSRVDGRREEILK